MTAKDTKKGNVYYNVTADVKSVKDTYGAALTMPETADALAMTNSLSFGGYDADPLAGLSAVSSPAELDDKSGWLNINMLA